MSASELAMATGLASLIGLRHAFEPDHVAAVSTLMARERRGQAAWLGAWWGLGHTLTIFAVGVLLAIGGAAMPTAAAGAFEWGVALMMLAFGVRAIGDATATRAHVRPDSGPRLASRFDPPGWRFARRPLLVGAIHGLAGSGALVAVVAATLPSPAAQLGYLLVFGAGSTFAMALLSAVLCWPIARLETHGAAARLVSLTVGCLSATLGLWRGYTLLDPF